ncbi:tyrosine-type recombinase/integrase [Desulfosarcina alkanivorans]|uniref:tyrosine-type recombinase/integrase n=1 Tax=Desulfosarcina alkanivorans TaxID=571177 RepID=UPI0038B38C46
MRHTFCSRIVLQGGDLKDAKEMIGHSDLSMTDRYTHLTLNRKKKLSRRLSDYYKDDGKPLDANSGPVRS